MSPPGRPLRIGINAAAVQQGGGLSYVHGILPHLAAAGSGVHVVVFAGADVSLPVGSSIEVRRQPQRSLLARAAWEQFLLPGILQREGIDVLYAPGNQGPVLRRANFVVFVQNVDPLVPPWTGTPMSFRVKMTALRSATLASVRRARAVVAVSGYVRSLLVEQAGLWSEAVEVVPHGAPEDAESAPSSAALSRLREWELVEGDGGSYVLAVSNVSYNKNYPALIRAFAHARRTLGLPIRLAIAGRVAHPWCVPDIRRAVRESGVEESVRWLGWVDAEVRRALFARAAALVFCSRVESFGLPALEAMAYGLPVVASDIPPVREVCADAAVYADPNDPGAIGEHLVRVVTDDSLRRRLIEAGRARARQYSWKGAAQRTLQILRRAVAGLIVGIR